MARSKYIYYILKNGNVHAAFTVKHELKTYLDTSEYLEDEIFSVFRIDDGGETDSIEITDEFYE